ncbi:NAD(P)H-dependent oxidoreductase [Treponema primitia]|uniref:flavodoxin n=1 Tax=Treponema primitia TaxID=88058 RepID=UPI00397EE53F
MKKVSIFLVIVLLVISHVACQGNKDTTAKNDTASSQGTIPANTPLKNDSNILIAYFTWADNTIVANPSSVDVDAATSASVLAPGDTARIAHWIKETVGGDLFSIKVTDPYSSDYNKCLDRAAEEKAKNTRPELSGSVKNIDAYDVLFLGYPNWWYSAPMALFSFLEQHDLSGKTVILFCTHGTGGLARSVRDISAAIPNSTIIENVFDVFRDDVASAQPNVKKWLTNLGY